MTAVSNFILSLSILFPFIICLVRYRVMKKTYHPFAILIFGALLTEFIAYYLARTYKANLWFLNIYSLFESLVLVYQFHRWGFMQKNVKRFRILIAVMIVAWIAENLIFSKITVGNRYYLIAYSFFLVMLSIRQINQDMMNGKKVMEESARLIICTGVMLFFTFGIVRETFTVFGKGLQSTSLDKIFVIVMITNVITNIIYAFGAYYIPKEKDYKAFFE